MSELSIINQKAGPLGEKNFGNPGVGNEIKSVGKITKPIIKKRSYC